jgi:replicative DNA helicase
MIDLERYFLLSLVLDPDSIGNVRNLISPEYLLGGDNQRVYQKILDLDELGREIDRFSLFMSGVLPQERLEKIFQLDIDGVILNPERFARFIIQRKLEEQFQKAGKEKDVQTGKLAIDGLLENEKGPSWKSIAEIEMNDTRGESFETGFTLDQRVRLRQTDLCIVAGRTGIGKTTLGMNMLQGISLRAPVGLISFEMVEYGIAKRLYLSMTGADIEERKETYFVAFPSAFNLSIVRRISREMIAKKAVKVIMVDYLQLMSETKKFSSRHLEVSWIVRQMKQIAKELNVLMILISSLGRSLDARGPKSKPVLGDLKESGDIEFAADQVLFLHRESDEASETELIVAKNRYGKKAVIDLVFEPERGRYVNGRERYDTDSSRRSTTIP